MHFCGQCGLQLPPGSTVCPRCGAPVDPDLVWEDDMHTDDATLPVHLARTQNPSDPDYQPTITPFSPPQQQPLILRPDERGYIPDEQIAGEPTSAVSRLSPVTQTPMPPTRLNTPPVASNNPAGNAPYWNYPPQAATGYQSLPGQYDAAQLPTGRERGRILVLLLILFCLLGILAGMIYYFLNFVLHKPVLTPSQQAQAVITQYYDDVNSRNYQAAYDLWANKPLPYDQFVQGYAHTQHDNIIFDSTTPMANGNVQVMITITATEQRGVGTVTSVYKGSYVVGQVNGTWKILRGSFRKV